MGRNRKPLALREGHLTQKERIELELKEDMVKSSSENIKPPTWLKDNFAKKEFKKLASLLKDIGILSKLDINNLAGYCISFSRYIQATTELQGKDLTVQKLLPNGSYTTVENPLVKICKTYADEMRKFAGLVGLTLDSRMRVSDTLLKRQNQENEDEFGDI